MKLTPRQRYQIIFVVIEEAQRLAQKFGLIEGLETLQIFRASTEIKDHGALVTLFEQDNTDTKTESSVNKAFKANEDTLLRIISEIFAIKLRSKSTSIGLTNVIDLSEKKLKKLSRSSSRELDSEELNEYVKIAIREYIKLKFGVSRNDIRDARIQLEKRFCEKSGEALSTISSCAKVPLLLLKNKKPQDFNYHGIAINGLYKLIKILNGVENKELARSFLHFFSVDNADNRQIIGTFFAVEKTAQYCRKSTMLVNALSLLVTHNPDYEALSDRFVTNIMAKPDKTSIESLMTISDDATISSLFNDLFESTLLITAQFNYILAVAKLNIAEREQRINELNSTQDVFLKSVFYFCFVSPLLELIESRLKQQNTWKDQDVQKLRLELSTAFHIMLGMRSGVVKNNSISRPPLLLELAMADKIQQKVIHSFAAISAVESGLLTEVDSLNKPNNTKHQRRRSRSTEGEHSLFSVKSKSSKNLLEQASSSTEKRKVRHDVAASSSSSEEHSPVTTESSKRAVYSTSRTMSFYRQTENSLSGPASSSAPSDVTAKARKRSQSSTADKKLARGISTGKIPRLLIPKIPQDDDSLELYFNNLFACDSGITTHFVLSLVRPKDKMKFSWGIRVLNEASGKSNQQIATVLLDHLSNTELLAVLAELFRMEATDSWCRGNKLISLLIQHYLGHEDRKEYKKMVWGAVFALSDSLSKIDRNQCESESFTVESFKTKHADIGIIQNDFLAVLNTILSPKQFPSFMQSIFQLGYADLLRRNELEASEEELIRKLVAFILNRFINPIIFQEAQLLTNPVLKQWYLTTVPSAIQSLTSPLNNLTRDADNIPTLRDLIFGPITKDIQQRNKIYMMMASALHVGSDVAAPTASESPEAWDNEQCKRDLNDLLKQEQFSGLSFKPNGTVTPRRDSPKPLVLTFFDPVPSESIPLSGRGTTPRREVVLTPPLQTVLESDVSDAEHDSDPSSSGIVTSSSVNFIV